MNTIKNIALTIISSTVFFSCSNDDDTNSNNVVSNDASITFDARVGASDFALDTPFTINGATYQFDNLRYWVSNIELVNANNETTQLNDSYFLLEETKEVAVQEGDFTYPAKKRETINVAGLPTGKYTKIRFSVGVDALYNDNLSLQAGELSQLNGMTNISWMWHTSYIFSSLVGKNTASNQAVVVETGLNANYRTVEITLATPFEVKANQANALSLNVDVAKIIDGIDLVATPTVSASTPAVMSSVANNFRDKVFTQKTAE
jgi:hypothetical protein